MSEAPFRIAFAAMFIGLVAVRVSLKRKAGAYEQGMGSQASDHLAHEKTALKVLRPALALPFYVFLFAWLFAAEWSRWAHLDLPVLLRWFGAVVGIVALGLIGWSMKSLGHNYHDTLRLRADHELVTSGPYHRQRHPIYLGFLLLMVAGFLLSANWVMGVSGTALIWGVIAVRAPAEEMLLAERFGQAYQDYRRRTGKLLPRRRTG